MNAVAYKQYHIGIRVSLGEDGRFTVIGEIRRNESDPKPLTTFLSSQRFASIDVAYKAGIMRGQKWVDEQVKRAIDKEAQ